MSLILNSGFTVGPGVVLDANPYILPQYSMVFNSTSSYIAVGGTNSDWNLGYNYTMEWWSKADHASNDRINTVMCQQPGVGIDIFYDSTQLAINNGSGDYIRTSAADSEPPIGVWTHVAVVNTLGTLAVYYNGVAQSINSNVGPSWTNTDYGIAVGERGFNSGTTPNGFQYFGGKLANIRISNVARYTGTFTPPLTLVVDANTKLALDGYLTDTSASVHTINNTGVSASTDFPAP
jgi:hypothetical protein